MILRLLLVLFCCTLSVEVLCIVPALWTKKLHEGAIRSGSIRGELGVSNDNSSIVVWRAERGDTNCTLVINGH